MPDNLVGLAFGAGLVAAAGGFWLLFVAGGVLSVLGGAMTLALRARERATLARG